MAPRRSRRSGGMPQNLPPLSGDNLANTLSCWYCDFKISGLNRILFSFGRRHARSLEVWFAIGVAFSLVAVFGVTMMLLWELLRDFLPYSGIFGPNSLLSWLFGISPLVRSFSISIMDSGILVFSSLISLSIHEFGHAIAAASEGIQSEYIAIFLAIIFPGALVAFNNDLLQSLPHFSALRIYCAGIWHNLMGESCMAPLSPPGISWVEISYSSPYSSECLLQQKNLTGDYESPSSGSTPCGGTFVFIGDALSMAISVRLSSYRPRWPFLMFSASIPTMLEKILNCNFHVSATYAFLNSLPVYFLDGASILETCLGYLTWLKLSRRRRLLRICLFTGTTLSVFGFSKVLYATTLQYP